MRNEWNEDLAILIEMSNAISLISYTLLSFHIIRYKDILAGPIRRRQRLSVPLKCLESNL